MGSLTRPQARNGVDGTQSWQPRPPYPTATDPTCLPGTLLPQWEGVLSTVTPSTRQASRKSSCLLPTSWLVTACFGLWPLCGTAGTRL